MPAGGSAYDVARRQREKAERLQRSAALWEQGAIGEVEVAKALEALPPGWVVLHDLAWPGRPRANIDHVVVGPGGVFVVDAKNWSGRVEVRNQVLRQNGRQREQTVVSAAEAAIAIQRIVPTTTTCVGVLCFVRNEPLTGCVRDVLVCSTDTLAAMLTSRPPVLTEEDVQLSVEAVHEVSQRRPGTARLQAQTRNATASRRRVAKRGRGKPLVTLVGGVVLLIALLGGGFEKAAGWVSEQVATVIVPTAPADPTPKKPVRQKNKPQNKPGDTSKSQRGGG